MTDPLVPPDCDLRAFAFMPLDVVRLRDSDIAAVSSGEEFRAAVLLWCASWHQIPAASLPDDDMILAQLAGFGRVIKEWKKVRSGALRGWILCSDGRLYHPVIADKAIEAWGRKIEQAWKTECARIKKQNQRNGTELAYPTFDEFVSRGTKRTSPQGHDVIVPDLSHWKRHPIDIDRDRDRDKEIPKDTSKQTRNTFPVKGGESVSVVGLSCKAMIDAGIEPTTVNQSHPDLLALIEAGATPEEFGNTATESVAKGHKKFAYVLGMVKNRRAETRVRQTQVGRQGPKAEDFQKRDYGTGGPL